MHRDLRHYNDVNIQLTPSPEDQSTMLALSESDGFPILNNFVYESRYEKGHWVPTRLRKIKTLEDDAKMKGMQSMIAGQEMERERIAKDLHDSLGGLLSTIKLQFDSVQSRNEEIKNLSEYQNANKLLDSAVNEVRSISRNLQPGALAELGLVPALKDLLNNFDGDHYPDVDLQVYDIPEKLDNIVSLSIFR